jgi:hypothetical protein
MVRYTGGAIDPKQHESYAPASLSPVALNHLAAMNELLMSVCGMPL